MKKTAISVITVIALIILTISSISLPILKADSPNPNWTSHWIVVDKFTGLGITTTVPSIHFTSSIAGEIIYDVPSNGKVDVALDPDFGPWNYYIWSNWQYEREAGVVDPSVQNYLIGLYPSCRLYGHVYDTSGHDVLGFDITIFGHDGLVLPGSLGDTNWVDIPYTSNNKELPLTIQISKNGYTPASYVIPLGSHTDITGIVFILGGSGVAIPDWSSTWSVVDKFTGNGIDATITFESKAIAPISKDPIIVIGGAPVTTDFAGAFSPWYYKVTAPGYEYSEGRVDPATNYALELYPAYILTGSVFDGSGKGFFGFDFTVLGHDGAMLMGLGGVYGDKVELQYGRYLNELPLTIEVSKVGYVTDSYIIPIGSNTDMQHDFTLRESSSQVNDWSSTWSIVDKYTGDGIDGAAITFTSHWDYSSKSYVASNGAVGEVSFSAKLSPWYYKVTAQGYEYGEGRVDPTTDPTIALYPAHMLTGSVLDESGKSVSGFDFTVLGHDGAMLMGLGGVYGDKVELQYGRYLNELPLTIEVSKAGYVTDSFVIPINSNTDMQHNFVLNTIPQNHIVHFGHTGSGAQPFVSYSINSGPLISVNAPFSINVLPGDSVAYNYPNTVASSSAGTQYVLTSSNPSSPLTINADLTVTGEYKTQYKVTASYSTSDVSTPTSNVVLTGTPSITTLTTSPQQVWLDAGTSWSINSLITAGSGTEKWELTSGNSADSVIESSTLAFPYNHQYQVSFVATPSDAGFTSPTGNNIWVNAGKLSVSALVSSNYIFSSWSSSSTSITFDAQTATTEANIGGSGTISANFASNAQTYSVIFFENGLPFGASWTVTFNGATKSTTSSSLKFDNVQLGTYGWTVEPISSGIGTRYLASSSSGSITVTGQTTQILEFKKQYYLTMNTNFGDTTPISGWFNAGQKVTISAISPTAIQGERYQWLGWTGIGLGSYSGRNTAITLTMNNPIKESAIWTHQYQLTVKTVGIPSPYSADVTIGCLQSGHASDASAFTTWITAGTSTGKIGIASTISAGSSTRCVFDSWSDASTANPKSSKIINAPTTLTANYKTQLKVTFTQYGVGSDFKGTIVKIDGVNYDRNDLPVSFWWNKNTDHLYQYLSPLKSGSSYIWKSTVGLSTLQSGTITISAAGIITGNYNRK